MDTNRRYTRLVLSGAGVRGLVHVGVLFYLHNEGALSEIQYYSGTSAGAFVCLLLSVGMTPQQIYESMYTLESPVETVRKYQSMSKSQVIERLSEIVSGAGLLPFEPFRDLFSEILAKALTENHNHEWSGGITFSELHSLTGKFLVVTGSDMSVGRAMYFCKDTTPDMDVMEAVQVSCSLPFIFRAGTTMCEGRVVDSSDGGFIDNFPVSCIDDGKARILGVVVGGDRSEEKSGKKSTTGFVSRSLRSMTLPLASLTNKTIQHTGDNVDTVIVRCTSTVVSAYDFIPTKEEMVTMFTTGFKEAEFWWSLRDIEVTGWGRTGLVFDVDRDRLRYVEG